MTNKNGILSLDNIWIWVLGLLGVGAAALFLGKKADTRSPPFTGNINFEPGQPSRYFSPSPHDYSPYTPPDPVNYSTQGLGANYGAAKKAGCGCNKGKSGVSNTSSI